MEVAFIHQVNADAFTVPVGKEDIIGQHNSGTGIAIRFKAAVNMLQGVELLVAGGKCEVMDSV